MQLDEAARDAAVANITWTTDLADLAPCDLVIEAAPENLELKKEIFAELDSILGPDVRSSPPTRRRTRSSRSRW